MKDRYRRIHQDLDTEEAHRSPCERVEEREEFDAYRRALTLLEASGEGAPPDFAKRVLAALPEQPDTSWLGRVLGSWPSGWKWAVPALAGALAAALLAVGVFRARDLAGADLVAVTFEFHAPGAQRVEVVGSFTDWKPDGIKLDGPDGSGHWSATVRLPSGLHEYLFLIDGTEWETDPNAAARRPDGFGLENALLQI